MIKIEYRLFYKKLLLQFISQEDESGSINITARAYNKSAHTFCDFPDCLYWWELPYYKELSPAAAAQWIAANDSQHRRF